MILSNVEIMNKKLCLGSTKKMYHDVQNVQGKQIHKKAYLISKNDHYHEAIAYLEQ